MITAILTAFNRPKNLEDQIQSLRNQTVPPEEIIVFYNKGDVPQKDLNFSDVKTVYLNYNSKFHARFAFALSCKTKYIAIFDDDTIPGYQWFETCIKEAQKREGIFGTSGILLESNSYNPHKKIGWNGEQSEYLKEVDLVGHAWFFEKRFLKYMWFDEPVSWDNGEDIQFSALAKIHGNIKTFVTPHPSDNKRIWGSIKGNTLGSDEHASWIKNKNHASERDLIVSAYIKKGWNPIWKTKTK